MNPFLTLTKAGCCCRRAAPRTPAPSATASPTRNPQPLARPAVRWPHLLAWLLGVGLSLSLTGCFGFLKPARSTTRHFVLSSLPDSEPTAPSHGSLAVGVGPVQLASYLFTTSLAVRKGTNEVDYLPDAAWAERLDTGVQRTVAANLARLLGTDQVRLSTWQNREVTVEVYLTVERLDVDIHGQGVLVAWWRVLSPGGAKTLRSGACHLVRPGPAPDTNPAGAVATLSDLVAELSRQLAQAIQRESDMQ